MKSAGIQKMSKSKCNVVEPRDIIKKYGADTARTFVMFAGPPDQSAAWSNAGAEGTFRFLRRLWSWTYSKRDELASAGAFDPKTATSDQKSLRRSLYQNVAQATADLDRMQYNTVVSAAMKMMNEITTPAPGIVVEVLAANGTQVEYDQPLFRVATAAGETH